MMNPKQIEHNPLKIAFDIDGCVADLLPPLLNCIQDKWGIKILPNEIARHRIEECSEATGEQITWCVNFVIARPKLVKPYPNAIRFIKYYVEQSGDTPLFITDRWDKGSTKKWLDKTLKIPYEVLFTDGEDKADIAKRKDVNIFVEDRNKHAERFDQTKQFMLLMDRPWNKRFNDHGSGYVIRVQDWFDIEKLYKAYKNNEYW